MKCKVCGSNKTREILYSINAHGRHIINLKDRFFVSQCGNCQAVFLNNINVNKSYYEKYYKLGYYDKIGIETGNLLDKLLTKVSNYSISRKAKLIISAAGKKMGKISILDVGCGSGIFLSGLDSLKFDKYGSEINKEGFEICKGRRINVFYGDISKINFGVKKFDVISLWHVLEHVKKPALLFNTIRDLLKPEGVLIFQTPNTDSLGFKIGKKYWFHLDSPRHLILYNNKSLEVLCKLTGFKITGITNEFYDYPLDLFWSVRKSFFRFLIYPLYPIFKLISGEHLTYICVKE